MQFSFPYCSSYLNAQKVLLQFEARIRIAISIKTKPYSRINFFDRIGLTVIDSKIQLIFIFVIFVVLLRNVRIKILEGLNIH